MKAIYEIRNNDNGKIYIGSTNNLRRRWEEHRRRLNNGKHNNRYLQRAWDKSGANFTFTVLEEVAQDEDLIPTEQKWLDLTRSYDDSIGYNILTTAGRMEFHGEGNGRARLTWEKVREMRAIYARGGITTRELARQFGVGRATTARVISGKAWAKDPEGTTYSPPKDRTSRGNYGSGTKNPAAKLTWEKVREMRSIYDRGEMGSTRLARKFGVSRATALGVVKRKSWKNDPNERP